MICGASPSPPSMGGCPSRTVTVKEHVAVLPLASVAVQLTVVVPTGKKLPEFRLQTTVTPEQLSAADAAAGRTRSLEENEKKSIREMMDLLLNQVSEEDRVLLTLKEVEGLSLKELQEIYGVNENALKVRLFRSRKRVLRVYKELKKRHAI